MVHFLLLKDTQLNCKSYLKVYMDLCNGFFETTRYSYLSPNLFDGLFSRRWHADALLSFLRKQQSRVLTPAIY